jgi:hypothetical protein
LNPSVDQRLAREPIRRLRPGKQYLDGFGREVERLLKAAAR